MKLKYMLIVLVIALLLFLGYSNNNLSVTGNTVIDNPIFVEVDKLEIYHFHGTQQCASCKAVGAYAEETVSTYFADELNSGEIVFDHINIDLPENRDLVIKYGATGASLWLGVYDGKEFMAEENVNVWYKIKDKEDYMNYLKGVIEQKLAGE
ncbi:MAG: nitrophenyl compound nitroreductase subunit ArsF family protein [archaeon]